jgi:phosphopantothenate synthetase
MSDYYSVYCEEEMADMEVNAYYLTQEKALKMAMDLLDEGNEEVAIVNMSKRLKEKVLAHLGEEVA